MRKYNDFRFNVDPGRYGNNYDEVRRLINTAREDSENELLESDRVSMADMKAITTRRGVKAILSGKVLNSGCKKYRKWRKYDKHVVKAMLTPPLQELYDDGKISYRKAKRVRKIVTKRMLSCFYAKAK